MREYCEAIAGQLGRLRKAGERYTAGFRGEDSTFVRFNRGRVRQAGAVRQLYLSLDWIVGGGSRHATAEVALGESPERDRARLARLVERLRDAAAAAPPDPLLHPPPESPGRERIRRGRLPETGAVVDAVLAGAGGGEGAAGPGLDLVGIWAAGPRWSGFASSEGLRHWDESESFNLDFSLHGAPDRAVKTTYAGLEWDAAELAARLARMEETAARLAQPSRTVPPGRYPAYLAPAALEEVTGLLSYSAFGVRAHRTKTTPLLALAEERAALAAGVRLAENTRDGLAPAFQEEGFPRPDEVCLIEGGRPRECLVSPRSAREYALACNGASAAEVPASLDMAAGELPRERVLEALGTGIWVSNLWYLNYSDRVRCRITGMTRFATFWVEGGRLAAPLAAMRFDDTLYRILGSELVALTAERELLLDPGTYRRRSAASARLPGALVGSLELTL